MFSLRNFVVSYLIYYTIKLVLWETSKNGKKWMFRKTFAMEIAIFFEREESCPE